MYTMDIYKNLEKQTAIATVQVVPGSPESIPKELYQQFNFRKHNKLDGDNNVTIVDMQVPVWWTRPLNEETDSAITLNSNGYYVCTLPFFLNKNQVWKAAYNVLVNKNNLPTLIQLKFNHQLMETELEKLSRMSFSVIINSLLKLGISKYDICCVNNDLLLRGKKIVGSERIFKKDSFNECLFINLKYLEEKELFDQIYVGKKTNAWPITGIIDEYPEITKEAFLEVYCDEFKKYLDQFEL